MYEQPGSPYCVVKLFRLVSLKTFIWLLTLLHVTAQPISVQHNLAMLLQELKEYVPKMSKNSEAGVHYTNHSLRAMR